MRPVLVALHAHPDDESIFTGGTIVTAVEAGWRVVLVVATDGERGSRPRAAGTDLAGHRRAEVRAAAAILGIERVEFLGFGDSGYETVSAPRGAQARGLVSGSLAAAHLDGAALAVRAVLVEEGATALTSYDSNGIYGHIDHVQVHEIASRSVVGSDCELYEATLDRDELRRMRSDLIGRGLDGSLWTSALTEQIGIDDGPDLIRVDVARHLPVKLAAVAAHSSQVLEAPSFMGLPAGAFHHLFGVEWFRVAATRTGPLPRAGGSERPRGRHRAGAGADLTATGAAGPRSGSGRVAVGPGVVQAERGIGGPLRIDVWTRRIWLRRQRPR